jgi:hypothetical protein
VWRLSTRSALKKLRAEEGADDRKLTLQRHLLGVVLGIMLTSPMVNAAGRCPAGESGCTIDNAPSRIQERVNEGAKKVISNETSVPNKVKEVKETVKDCLNCGMDALRDGVNSLKSVK